MNALCPEGKYLMQSVGWSKPGLFVVNPLSPRFGLLGIGDIERVFRVPVLGQAQMEQRLAGAAQQGFNRRVHAPDARHGCPRRQ